MELKDLAVMSNDELEQLLLKGRGPAPEALAGFEWRGYNRPAWAALLGIRKFIKGFFKEAGGVGGYNIPPRQNAITEPWIHKPSPEDPKRFAFYTVGKVDMESQDNLYPDATFLDYGASPHNIAVDPARVIRDYVVQPDPANPDLMLGKAYLALGPFRLFSNFFIIERLRPTDWKP